jgi:hypothetical protein
MAVKINLLSTDPLDLLDSDTTGMNLVEAAVVARVAAHKEYRDPALATVLSIIARQIVLAGDLLDEWADDCESHDWLRDRDIYRKLTADLDEALDQISPVIATLAAAHPALHDGAPI